MRGQLERSNTAARKKPKVFPDGKNHSRDAQLAHRAETVTPDPGLRALLGSQRLRGLRAHVAVKILDEALRLQPGARLGHGRTHLGAHLLAAGLRIHALHDCGGLPTAQPLRRLPRRAVCEEKTGAAFSQGQTPPFEALFPQSRDSG